jgi:hypothetical protein
MAQKRHIVAPRLRDASSVAVARLDPRVVAAIRSATDDSSSFAEIWRRVRPVLERRGLACPGYGAVRRIVRDERFRRSHPPDPIGPVRVDLVAGRIWTT